MAKIYISNHVESVYQLYREVIENRKLYDTLLKQLTAFHGILHNAYQVKNPAVIIEITNYYQEKVSGLTTDEIFLLNLDEEDFYQIVARAYGFSDWKSVIENGDKYFDEDFEQAVDALVNGNIEGLKRLLHGKPYLLKQRSIYGHQGSLIHYVSSNGVEIWRQKVPLNLLEILRLLIKEGVDLEMKCKVYGGEFTVLSPLASSDHPKQAGLQEELLKILSND